MAYYSAIKKNKLVIHAKTWMNLKIVYYMIHLYKVLEQAKLIYSENLKKAVAKRVGTKNK